MIRSIVHHAYLSAIAVCAAASLVAPIATAATCQRDLPIPFVAAGEECRAANAAILARVNRLANGTYAYQSKLLVGTGGGVALLRADGARARSTTGAICELALDPGPVDNFFGLARSCLSNDATKARIAA